MQITDDLTEEQIKHLCEFTKRMTSALQIEDELKKKTDAEIAELLLQRIWAYQEIHSFESMLLEQAFERLRSKK